MHLVDKVARCGKEKTVVSGVEENYGRSGAGVGERRLGEGGDVGSRPLEPIIHLVSADRLLKICR